MIVDAVEEVRDAVGGEVDAVGFGIPCTFDRAPGMAVQAVNLPLARPRRSREVMAERLGLPVSVDNDANCAALAEARAGAARGLLGGRDAHARHRDRRRAGARRRALPRLRSARAPSSGHMVVDIDGPPCQGNCPNRGCLEAVASGHGARARGVAGGRAAPGHARSAARSRRAAS